MVSLRVTETLKIPIQNLLTTNISSIKWYFTALELKIKFLNDLISLQVFQISKLKKHHKQSSLTVNTACCIADILFSCTLTSCQNTENPCFVLKIESQTSFQSLRNQTFLPFTDVLPILYLKKESTYRSSRPYKGNIYYQVLFLFQEHAIPTHLEQLPNWVQFSMHYGKGFQRSIQWTYNL